MNPQIMEFINEISTWLQMIVLVASDGIRIILLLIVFGLSALACCMYLKNLKDELND